MLSYVIIMILLYIIYLLYTEIMECSKLKCNNIENEQNDVSELLSGMFNDPTVWIGKSELGQNSKRT